MGLHIYTEVSGSNRKRNGSIAATIVLPDGVKTHVSHFYKDITTNQLQIMSVLDALDAIPEHIKDGVIIHTRSHYIHAWFKYYKKNTSPTVNSELFPHFVLAMDNHKVIVSDIDNDLLAEKTKSLAVKTNPKQKGFRHDPKKKRKQKGKKKVRMKFAGPEMHLKCGNTSCGVTYWGTPNRTPHRCDTCYKALHRQVSS